MTLTPVAFKKHSTCVGSIGHEPGVGDIDFPPLLSLLAELGYEGAVGLEYKPSTASTEAALQWAQPYLRP